MEIRTTYHRKMKEIQNDLLMMGSMVEKAIHLSINALKERDIDLAKRIIDDDNKVDVKRFEIEDKCIQLIATQQPMASDLRTIISVFNI